MNRLVRVAHARHFATQNELISRTHVGLNLPPPRLNYREIAENVLFKSHNAFNRKAQIRVGAVQTIERLYREHTDLSSALNAKRAEHNSLIKLVQSSPADDKAQIISDSKALKTAIQELEREVAALDQRLYAESLSLPNDTHPDVPIGPESAAVVLSQHGPDCLPSSPHRDHVRVGKHFNLLDLEAGSLVTGSSWYYLINEGAILELALINYALSIAMQHGFKPVLTPDVVKADVASRCGFQPRDHGDYPVHQMYHISSTSGPELVLSGTAEIPLAGMFANQTIEHGRLPQKVVGIGKAFRSEAGARGADTRGLFRVHQFSKVELFAVTDAGSSSGMMQEVRDLQVRIFEGLQVPFRVLDMPTEELGASAYRKYDMEAWMPGRGKWGEISSTSNCTDYQARRLHIRHEKDEHRKSSSFAHTLNGTASAIPRLIVALLENGAEVDGEGAITRLHLPSAIRPFWIGDSSRDFIRWKPSANEPRH